MPLVHVLIPNSWDRLDEGLDGIAVDLPALTVEPTHHGLVPLNLQVKDPLWPMRNLFDFTFSVKPGEAKTIWLDVRDRLLPAESGLWLTLAGASGDFCPAVLVGAKVRLVFKPRAPARVEHEADRFTQVRDEFAMLVEEWPNSPKLNLWVRFERDLKDLLRINPAHELGRQYAAISALAAPRPSYVLRVPPPGVPRWAFLQSELLGRVKKFVLWYIEHRQEPYGDFGGGISDDVDLTNLWPGIALMGIEPEAVQHSLRALLEAVYKNGMLTKGLPTIQLDELHTYEEGLNCLAQDLMLEYGSPRQLERAMETARGIDWISGINQAGHRHFRTSYFSATKLAEEMPWGVSRPQTFLSLHPGLLLVDYNGAPAARRTMLELADGQLAHRRVDGAGHATLPAQIAYADDREIEWRSVRTPNPPFPWHLYWGAWKWTGDRRYLQPLFDQGLMSFLEVNANALDLLGLRQELGASILRATANPDGPYRWGAGGRPALPRGEVARWQLSGDKSRLEKIYAAEIESCDLLEYTNTDGSLWIDRVGVPTAELQRTRLGGVALVRGSLYPGHTVSWRFAAPANEQSVAILIPNATPTAFKVMAYNLDSQPVQATMTGWNIDPGRWEIAQGVDTNDDDAADTAISSRAERFERSRSVEITFPPKAVTVLTFELKTPGTPYWSRPDLGLDREDVTIVTGQLHVRVHSLGGVASPRTALVFRAGSGHVIASASVPPLEPPSDLHPRATEIVLPLPAGTTVDGATVEIDPDGQNEEITRLNNAVRL